MPIVKCDYCGKEVFKTNQAFKRNKYNYCSKECENLGKRTKVLVKRICEICGKEFLVSESSIKRGRGKCCSIECRHKRNEKTNNIYIKENYAEIVITKKNNEIITVLIDIEDIEKIQKLKWRVSKNKNGYYVRAWGRKDYKYKQIVYLHRYIMNCPGDMEVDHINHNTLDNRKCNLRVCTMLENKQNVPKRENNKSGYRNIHWDKNRKKWRVRMTINKKEVKVGIYETVEEALIARNNFIKENNLIFKMNEKVEK